MKKNPSISKRLIFAFIAFVVFTLLTQLTLSVVNNFNIKNGFVRVIIFLGCFYIARIVYKFLCNPSEYKSLYKVEKESKKPAINYTEKDILDSVSFNKEANKEKDDETNYSLYRKKDLRLFFHIIINTALCFIISFPAFYYTDKTNLYLDFYPYIYGCWMLLFGIYAFTEKANKYL